MTRNSRLLLSALAPAILYLTTQAATPPKLGSRKAPLLTKDGLQFRDLNKNGTLEPYEDWRLPIEKRVADLVARMTPEEKAGLMIHSSLSGFTGPNGEVLGVPSTPGRGGPPRGTASNANRAFLGRANQNNVEPMGSANPNQLVVERNVRYILVRPNAGEPPEITAKFHNGLQELAEAGRLGIPIVFSTDPRHGTARPGAGKPVLSQWPDQLGLAAARDLELTRQFGQIAARELRAIGIQCLLGPMADTTTEPRWNRISGTFGEDANLNATLIKAIIEGFQGKQLGPESVMTVTKHFPGDGPVKDGYDGHNNYGKWTIYPGNQFDLHLIPFSAALEAGTGGMMGGYFIPVGKDTVAINFSKLMINGLLREKMGYQGLVVTDWLRNMPWGVEKLSEKDRQKMMVLAGVDQIGGDNDPSVILASVKDGGIPMTVLDTAARRILRPIFQLGLFENPYVDPDQAKTSVASEAYLAKGYEAQIRSTVLLKNAADILPAVSGKRIYVEGIAPEVAARYGTVVDDPKSADLAILRVATPATNYPYGGAFAMGFARGNSAPTPPPPVATYGITLAYGNAANWTVLEGIRKVAASGTPTVVIVNMDKPAILTEFIDSVAGALAAFGASDAAALDIVFGKAKPTGKLPFDMPSDMPSVMSQAADVPFDMDDPLFKFGFGLTYNR
ncbi:glycoside hydrolase family 3 protein [Paludibaculum fermentans]|uniref:beta-glucosidase n=1 Tax=Paludibaculum fermentans TaxID=1473598 RepID=A0A7S7NJT4_PALFE|nr:glycoside hydrolase family 3 N-terminal domain-containing protein [Paludibaculum fermentans]QOY84902.1 glycoside hydrolase family 3 C-terminal domain-containing protein [Paludibaculum fermentans]